MTTTSAKVTFQEKFENFMRTKGLILWVVLGLAVVSVVGLFVWFEINKAIEEQSAMEVEKVEEQYQTWLRETDAAKKNDTENSVVEALNGLIAKYPSRYAGQRALFIRAGYFYDKKEWDKATADYLDLDKSFPKSILAPISLVNAASCQEESDKWQDSVKLYEKLINSHKDSYYIPYAIYSIARIYDQHEDYTNARQWYTRLEDEHGQTSEWAKLGKNRMIFLKAKGRIN